MGATRAALLKSLDSRRSHVLGTLEGLEEGALCRAVLPTGGHALAWYNTSRSTWKGESVADAARRTLGPKYRRAIPEDATGKSAQILRPHYAAQVLGG